MAKSTAKPRAKYVLLREALITWYRSQQRPLPWRKNRDPYRIWVSEVMLQQTTVTAVIPYYERFMARFPTLESLAEADREEVLRLWTGLGYYSRARNLHKAAQTLAERGFPKTFRELIEFPGFGPYTARAVTSLAFGEPVGVLDGNVIRVLCRLFNRKLAWWTNAGRNELQTLADELVQDTPVHEMNQALMELGATVCTPSSPACLICPWQNHCAAFREQTACELPLPKPRKPKEIWLWQPLILHKNKKIAVVKNDYAPFLKGQWIYPGSAKKLKAAPARFDFRHTVTHHEIYVRPQKKAGRETADSGKWSWAVRDRIHEWNPSVLLTKALKEAHR